MEHATEKFIFKKQPGACFYTLHVKCGLKSYLNVVKKLYLLVSIYRNSIALYSTIPT